jgi:hypothetical protein
MNYGLKLTLLLTTSLFIFACSKQNPAEPSCRVNALHASSHQGGGACVVRMNNKLLVTQLTSGLYDLPSAIHIASKGRIHDSAQCLAHHAMWRDTGLNVEVQQVVGTQTDGTWLFSCEVNAGFDGTEEPFAAPPWSNDNVEYIAFIDPFNIELQNWANRDHFTVMRDAYVLEGVQKASP